MRRRFLIQVFLLSANALWLPSRGSASVGKLIKALSTLSTSSGRVAAKDSIKNSAVNKGARLSAESAAAYAARSAAQKVAGSTPYASRNTATLANALSILDSSVSVSFALREIFQKESDVARVLEGPSGAVTSTAIYYLLLQECSRQAHIAMWVDLPLQNFKGSGAGNAYSIRKLQKNTMMGTWYP
ncbi:hypothetical protein [Donghicola mangrovi]|uniref:Uncharacterized protein n=1 Tax=Donghicola mangrovi TaxID=2729614 RepID=A0A850QFN2_9RHOB|nr:hypothetical protein [Donghicola mangrovi]NVO24909.1 hypothetical protein [Donghicola mangrovi]